MESRWTESGRWADAMRSLPTSNMTCHDVVMMNHSSLSLGWSEAGNITLSIAKKYNKRTHTCAS